MQEYSAPDAAQASQDPTAAARAEFHLTFNLHCRTPLDNYARQQLAVISQQTIEDAIMAGDHTWGEDKAHDRRLMKAVAVIARRTRKTAGTEVSIKELAETADRVIRFLKRRYGFIPPKEYLGPYCKAYQFGAGGTTENEDPSTTSTGAERKPDPEMVERARAAFIVHAHRWVGEEGFDTDAVCYLNEKLFRQTVQAAITSQVDTLDWDNDHRRRRFALRRLEEIVELASFKAEGELVSRPLLHTAACDVIRIWDPVCKLRKHWRKVYCDNFTYNDAGA